MAATTNDILMYCVFAQTLLFAPLVLAIGVTSLRNFARWRIFKARGYPYTVSLVASVLLLILVSLVLSVCLEAVPWTSPATPAVAILTVVQECALLYVIGVIVSLVLSVCLEAVPWTSPATPAVAILTVVQECALLYVIGVIVTRQWVLALLFRTLTCGNRHVQLAKQARVTPVVFVGGPFIIAFLYLLIVQLPSQLNVFGVVTSRTAVSYTGVAYGVVLGLTTFYLAFFNRKIPFALFYDYGVNLVCFTTAFVLFVGGQALIHVFFDSPDNNDPVGRRLAYSNLFIVLAVIVQLTLIRPAWAIWRSDIAYLERFEERGGLRSLVLDPVETAASLHSMKLNPMSADA